MTSVNKGFRSLALRKRRKSSSDSEDSNYDDTSDNRGSDSSVELRRSPRLKEMQFLGYTEPLPTTKGRRITSDDMMLIYLASQRIHCLPAYVKKGGRDDPILEVDVLKKSPDSFEDCNLNDKQKYTFDCFKEYATVWLKDLTWSSGQDEWVDVVGLEHRVRKSKELFKSKKYYCDVEGLLCLFYDAMVNKAGFTNGCGERALESLLKITKVILYADEEKRYSKLFLGVSVVGASKSYEDNFGVCAYFFNIPCGKTKEETMQQIKEDSDFSVGAISHCYTADVCMYYRTIQDGYSPYLFGKCKSRCPDYNKTVKQTWVQSLRGLRNSNETCGIAINYLSSVLVKSAIKGDKLVSRVVELEFREEDGDEVKFSMEQFFSLIAKVAKVVQQNHVETEENLIF